MGYGLPATAAGIEDLPAVGEELAPLYHGRNELEGSPRFLTDFLDGRMGVFTDVFDDDLFVFTLLVIAFRADIHSPSIVDEHLAAFFAVAECRFFLHDHGKTSFLGAAGAI